MEGVAGGELCGGRRLGRIWGLELRRFLVVFEGLGSSAWSRGGVWWHWMGGGSSACDARPWNAAAAEATGDEEDGLSPTIAGYGGSREMA